MMSTISSVLSLVCVLAIAVAKPTEHLSDSPILQSNDVDGLAVNCCGTTADSVRLSQVKPRASVYCEWCLVKIKFDLHGNGCGIGPYNRSK